MDQLYALLFSAALIGGAVYLGVHFTPDDWTPLDPWRRRAKDDAPSAEPNMTPPKPPDVGVKIKRHWRSR
jgi:hypothetical protein